MKQHVKFIQYTHLKTLTLTYLQKKYLVMRFKGIKDLIFSSSNMKHHVKLLEEVTKFYLVNILRTSVIPFFVGSHRKVKRWSGIVLIGQRHFGESFETFAKWVKNTQRPSRYLCKFSSRNFIYCGRIEHKRVKKLKWESDLRQKGKIIWHLLILRHWLIYIWQGRLPACRTTKPDGKRVYGLYKKKIKYYQIIFLV